MDCLKIKLKRLNAHITCYICKGYFVDATTVIDCLHTFCRSCLMKHFESDNRCPKCESVIHQSHPSHYVSFDRTMQDIVYKIMPEMYKNEIERRQEFFKERGLEFEPEMISDEGYSNGLDENEKSKQLYEAAKDIDFHRNDEQINIILETECSNMKKICRKYIRCSNQATVGHLKKYLAKKLYWDNERSKDIDILCNDELMGKDHSLRFIQRTRWRLKSSHPLELQYRKHVDF